MAMFVSLAALLLAAPAPPAAPAEAAEHARIAATLATLFSDEDYPAAALRNGEQGSVAFRLEIGTDGKPDACSVTTSSGSSILDTTTCRLLMERARFQPARDARGKVMRDSYDGRIVWRLPAAPSGTDIAQALWSACVTGEAAKLVPGDLPADEIVRRAFPPCAALEGILARRLQVQPPLTEPRASMMRLFETGLAETRAALNAPPESDAPQD